MNRKIAFTLFSLFWVIFGGPMATLVIVQFFGLSGNMVAVTGGFVWVLPSVLCFVLLARQA